MKMEEGYMFIEYPDILTIEDTLEILDIGRNTLYALLRTGDLKAFNNQIELVAEGSSITDVLCNQI